MALHRRFRSAFRNRAPRGTARFAKPLQGPFSLVAKHPQKHKNRPEIGRFSHFNPGAEMHLFSLFSASKSPEKWLYDAICRKKQLFAGSFGSRSHSSCSFTLCARLGGPFLDVAQVKKLMLRHDGCVALKANTWRESTFTVLQSLPVEQRGAYCVLKTVELVYLLCSVHPLPI